MVPPRRQETEATRKRRAELAKLRQGPDGKWESNARKAAARQARRKSIKLHSLLARSRDRKAATDAVALEQALQLNQELEQVVDEAGFLKLLPRLNTLVVTAAIIRRTRIPLTLKALGERCPPAKEVFRPILQRWRRIFQQDNQRAKVEAASPSAAVHAARQAATGASVSAGAGSSSSSSGSGPVASSARPMTSSSVVASGSSSSTRLGSVAAATASRRRSASVSSTSSSSSSSSSSGSSSDCEELPAQKGQTSGQKPSQSEGKEDSKVWPGRQKKMKQRRITAFFSAGGGA